MLESPASEVTTPEPVYSVEDVLDTTGTPLVRFTAPKLIRNLRTLGVPNRFVIIKGKITTFQRICNRQQPIAVLTSDGSIVNDQGRLGTYPDDMMVLSILPACASYVPLPPQDLDVLDGVLGPEEVE